MDELLHNMTTKTSHKGKDQSTHVRESE